MVILDANQLTPVFASDVIVVASYLGVGSWQGSCSTTDGDSICAISIKLPADLFAKASPSTLLTATVSVNGAFAVDAGVATQVLTPPLTLIHTSPKQIQVTLPQAAQSVGKVFNVSVAAVAPQGVHTNTFNIGVTVSNNLRVVGFTIDPSSWLADTLISDANHGAVAAILQSASASSLSSFFQVQLEVVSVSSATASFSLTLSSWTDNNGNVITANINYVGGSGTGYVSIDQGHIISFVPFPRVVNLFNTAIFTGDAVVSPLSVIGFYADGTTQRILSGITCSSSNANALSVAPDCSQLMLNGAETAGGTVVVTAKFPTAVSGSSMNVNVWYPQGSLSIQATDTTLNVVTGWFSPDDNCLQAYQQAELRVFATFAMNSNVVTLQVTRDVASLLNSDNPSVLAISNNVARVPLVKGLSSGTTTVSLRNPSGQLFATTSISVSNVPVTVVAITSIPVVSIDLAVDHNAVYLGASTVTATLVNKFTNPFQTAYVYSAAVFSDGTQFSLEYDQNVTLTPGNKVVHVSASSATDIIPSGSGLSTVSTSWVSQCPDNASIGSGSFEVSVAYEIVVALIVTAPVRLLAPVDDLATLSPSNAPTLSTVNVALKYASGLTVDVTTNMHVTYSVSSPIIVVSTSSNSVHVSAGEGYGVANLTITYTFGTTVLTFDVTYTVVKALSVSLVPRAYPAYPSSNTVVLTALHPISFTSAYQKALLQVLLIRSDGLQFDVSTQASNTFSFSIDTQFVDIGAFIVQKTTSDGVIITKSPSIDAYGTVGVSVSVGYLTSTSVFIVFSNNPVVVLSIFNIRIPSTLVSTAQVQVSILFNDTTQLTNYYVNGNEAVPGLIQLSTDPQYANVDSSTGLLVAVHNSPSTLNLLATNRVNNRVSVTAQVPFSVNLAAALGDVDLGIQASGVAIPSVPSIGTQFTVPVFANLGNYVVQAIQIRITYDAKVLQVLSCTQGAGWIGGQFERSINDPKGVIVIGGITGATTGADAQLAVLMFNTTGGAGTVTTIASFVQVLADKNLLPIGTFQGQSSVAGLVPVLIAPALTRRDSQQTSSPVFDTSVNGRRDACDTPLVGDVNRDCLLNMLDAAIIQGAVLRSTFNASYIRRQYTADQQTAMDVDENGIVNLQDAQYTINVVFHRYRLVVQKPFFTNEGIIGSTCVFSIGVRLLNDDYSVPLPNSTVVIFDIDSKDPVLKSQLSNTPIKGSFIANKPNGFYGSIFSSVSNGDGLYFVTLPGTFTLTQDLAVSIVIATLDSNNNVDSSRLTPLLRNDSVYASPKFPVLLQTVSVPTPFNASAKFNVNLNAASGYAPFVTIPSAKANACQPTSIVTPIAPSTGSSSSTNLLGLIALVAIVVIVVVVIVVVVHRRKPKFEVFSVRVALKQDINRADHHPFENDGCNYGYEVRTKDDSQYILGREIWVVRQRTYTFTFDKSVNKDYPMYLSTSDYGGGNGVEEYLNGVQNSPALYGSPQLLFTPSLDCPNVLYYQCTKQKNMGYKIYVVDSQAQCGRPVFEHASTDPFDDEAAADVMNKNSSNVSSSKADDHHEDDDTRVEHAIEIPLPVYRAPPPYQRPLSLSIQSTATSPEMSKSTATSPPIQTSPLITEITTAAGTHVAGSNVSSRRAPPYLPPPSYVNSLKYSTTGRTAAANTTTLSSATSPGDISASLPRPPSYNAPPAYASIVNAIRSQPSSRQATNATSPRLASRSDGTGSRQGSAAINATSLRAPADVVVNMNEGNTDLADESTGHVVLQPMDGSKDLDTSA